MPDTSQGKPVSRRSFLDILLKTGLLAWLASVVYPIFEFLKIPPQDESAPTSVVAGSLKDLAAKQSIVFRFGNEPAILLIGPDGKPRAFSAVCTHLQCTVQYRKDMQKIFCACHNGMYDTNGRNISGPPPRPLQEFTVALKGDQIVVSRGQA